MDEIINALKSIIKVPDDVSPDFLVMNKRYAPLPIDYANFHKIISETVGNMLFVDGGNALLFESPNFCLGFIRVAGVYYQENVRKQKNLKEFYIVIKEENSKFKIKTFPKTSFDELIFDPDDESLRMGKEKCNISRIVSIIRRFAELDYACALDKEELDYILLDGTLEARYPFEMNYLNKLFQTGKVSSLSKTCSLTTMHGNAITKKLIDMNNKDAWYYFPSLNNNNAEHLAEIYFVRLHNKSEYVFRFEIQQGFSKSPIKLFSTMMANSNDPIFLGYPYGFIDVDQNARVSDEESNMLRMRYAAKLGKEWHELSKLLNSMNAHDILDKIRF